MGSIAIGPVFLAADRFATIVGLLAFAGANLALSEKVDRRFERWSGEVLLCGLIVARLGYVLEHHSSFAEEPWRVIAVWQGGFSWPWAVLPIAALAWFRLADTLRLWGLLTLASAIVVSNLALQLTTSPAGQRLPDLTLEQLDGPPFALAADAGKPRVINVWATWCPPCRREMPLLAGAAKANPAVLFLFVNQAESRNAAMTYLSNARLAISHVLMDPLSAVSRHYGLAGVPVTLFIDRHGMLLDMHTGEISREALQDKVGRLTSTPPTAPVPPS